MATFKAHNTITGEVRQFDYLYQLAAIRGNGWTAGESIDKAADEINRRSEKGNDNDDGDR